MFPRRKTGRRHSFRCGYLRRRMTVGGPPPLSWACVDLVTPGGPTLPRIAGEELEIRAWTKPLDPLVDLVRLAAVLAPGRDNQLAHIPIPPHGVATCRQQALLRIGAGPIPHTGEIGRFPVEPLTGLDPIEADRLVGEPPGPDDLQR